MADITRDEAAEVVLIDGAGTNEATINTDGTLATRANEQQLAAENKVFTMNFEVSSLGTTEIPVALFRNPSGSGKTVKLIRLTLTNFTTVNGFIRVRAYVGPTVTADGTSITGACTHVGQAGPVAVSFSSPTISANGTRFAQWETTAFTNALVIPLDLLFILDANTTVLLTSQADGTNRVIGGSLLWAEV